MFENIEKNDALLWCQTIVRLCGPAQLSLQKLPHFGDLGDDELRDYLEVMVGNGSDMLDDGLGITSGVRKRLRQMRSLYR